MLESSFLAVIVMGCLGAAWLLLRYFEKRTETEWDDRLVDVIEGLASTAGIDPDELARRSTGALKNRIVKEVVKKRLDPPRFTRPKA